MYYLTSILSVRGFAAYVKYKVYYIAVFVRRNIIIAGR